MNFWPKGRVAINGPFHETREMRSELKSSRHLQSMFADKEK